MQLRLPFVPAMAAAVFSVSACGPSTPTYHSDVAPLLARECTSCHQAGGIGPFTLVSYDDARQYADAIAAATAARFMPPMTVDASGACQSYSDARWLSDEEIALLGAWLSAGAPEGPTPSTPIRVPPVDTLADADHVVAMREPYTPQPSAEFPNDDYRCFFLDGPPADAYVTGFEIVPGEPREVHHMLLFALLSDELEDEAAVLEAEDDLPGWECFSTPIDEAITLVAGWAPGTNVMRYPDGTGLFVPGGRKLVMQLHYNLLAGEAVPDATQLKLRTVATVDKEAGMFPLLDDNLVIPPGEPAAKYSFAQPLVGLSVDLEAHGVFPHMHQLGRTLRFDLRPFGATDDSEAFCMTEVPRWDFQWQQLFLYEEPIRVTPSDVLHVECTYDTTSRTEPVLWGEGTQDEMCLVFVYVTRADGGSLADLLEHEH